MTSWSTNAVKPLLSSVHLFACSLKTLKFCDIYPRDLLLWTLQLCKQHLLCCHSVWTMTNMTKIFSVWYWHNVFPTIFLIFCPTQPMAWLDIVVSEKKKILAGLFLVSSKWMLCGFSKPLADFRPKYVILF